MFIHFMRLCPLAFYLLLASCGQVAELIQYADSASEAQDLNHRVSELSHSSFNSMPVAGTVSYTGHASVVFIQNGAEVGLLGQAIVTADFTNAQISGRIDEVFGGTGLSDLQSYGGELIFDGQIGVRRPNSFDAVILGQLSGGGQTIAVNGPLMGDFRGMGGQAISAITNAQMQATVNGVEAEVRVRVTAER